MLSGMTIYPAVVNFLWYMCTKSHKKLTGSRHSYCNDEMRVDFWTTMWQHLLQLCGVVVNMLISISTVALHRARLLLGWVTVY